jgi:hypothetical protein
MPIQKLLFIDANIWLDFYRSRNEISLPLLIEIEKITDRIIVTYQLESEFKRNRQRAILEGMQELKTPPSIPRLGIFSDTRATSKMSQSMKTVESSIKSLKVRLRKALANPAGNDPVYQACQRIFHRNGDDLVLTRESKIRHEIRRKALKRFLHGCPPRKANDTSIGDAINWEWMIHCADAHAAELVIVSRDSDYGLTFESKSYVNDHLKQEFSERVSRKRHLLLYTKVSDALKHFEIPVSAAITNAETEFVDSTKQVPSPVLPETPKPVTLEETINHLRAAFLHWKDLSGLKTGQAKD